MNDKVLIVEDEAVLSMQIKYELLQMGYSVTGISDTGEKALASIAIEMPDIVLMDITLKGKLNGIETADLIHKQHNIPIIYMTAHSEKGIIEMAKLTSPYGYLLKPVNIKELQITLDVTLYKSKIDKEKTELTGRLLSMTHQQHIILDNASIGISLIRERKFIWLNSKLAEIFGFTREDLEGQNTRILYPSQEAYEEFGKEAYCKLAKGVVCSEEIEMVRRDGSKLWCKYSGKAINSSDLSIGSIWIIEDITYRKQIEEELKRKNEQLEQINKELKEAALKEYRQRLEKEEMLVQQSKMAAMGEMIRAIAHQWKQPLNILGLIVQEIRDSYEYGELDKTQIDTTVNESLKQIHFMSNTIEDFQNFMKPDKEKQLFSVQKAVGEMFSLLSAQMKVNNISYSFTCHIHNKTFPETEECDQECEQCVISSNKNEFKQVILNLLTNSKDAILDRREKGLMKKTDEGNIMIDLYDDYDKIIIEQSDNGGGIPQEHILKVFDTYFTTKGTGKGSGIGLYMSKVIIEQHMGGSIHASNGEYGAVFTVKLPKRYF
ncbi:ATP-binding protein [Candidatus Magnetominusculus xianensis]|uniref:histidine kinase n=1 Tax=Candidatus Magnetominusculus xianensis TaxID=1748249 RepID=A0ABR5SBY3_9BACT|nr:ATP-binding protein [Candidatus Magnetominusculus xianensis]KWT78353.1 multi-sensor signal transduction histidine kinase [Candidatus Magnetominusculus xianensis]MBF0402891.1 response regulator [Nitrospirota bacterium]